MTNMYVANATRQTHEFLYRLPENTGSFRQIIQPGLQIKVPQDLSPTDVDSILEQHARYGMIHVDRIAGHKQVAGLVYSLDKPVSERQLTALMNNNLRLLTERGQRVRQEAAVATHESIERNIQESRMPDQLRGLDMYVEEMVAPRDERGERPEGSVEVAEGVQVSRDAPEGKPAASSRRRTRM